MDQVCVQTLAKAYRHDERDGQREAETKVALPSRPPGQKSVSHQRAPAFAIWFNGA